MAKKEKNNESKKRGNGDGSFRQRNGKWTLTITDGRDTLTGKVKRKSFTGKTKQESRDKRDAYLAAKKTGTYLEPSKLTVSEWLTDWLEQYKKNNIAKSSFDTCESHVNVHLRPSIGNIKLQNLKTENIQKMYTDKFNNGEGLKEETIRHVHVTLKEALEKAVELEYINKNPAKPCVLPKDNEKLKNNVLFAEDLKKITNVLDKNNTIDVLIMLDMVTGARKGEIIPITWDDIDLEKNELKIDKAYSKVKIRNNIEYEGKEFKGPKYENIIKPPKTKTSNRNIPFPDNMVPILKYHKSRIEKLMAENEIKGDGCNLVFPSENFTLLDPHNINRRWKSILLKAGVEYKSFHSLRHSFTSQLLENGENIKSIQELLGHSSAQITLDVYSHTRGSVKKSAVSKLNYLLPNEDNADDNNGTKETNIIYIAS